MPALNFIPRFENKIIRGEKCMTIRKKRKKPIKVGDDLYIYIGQRTKSCKLIAKVKCCRVSEIKITDKEIFMNGERLNIYQAELLAVEDGFNDIADFIEFFKVTHGLPFCGVSIYWE